MPQNIIFSVVADIKQFVAGMQGASKESEKTKEKVKEVKTETTELGKVMDGLQSKIAGAFAVGSIIAFGKQVAQIGAVFDNLTIRVNSLAGSVKDGEIAMQSLQNMSKKLGIDLKVLTENYINFITAAKSSGMAVATAEKAFKSMNIAMAGAGVSAQTQTQVFQSLQMMIGKSAVSSMQLKQVFMAMPESFDVMAKTLGVTNKELHKMLKSGEVMAGDVLPEFARNMEIALGGDAQKMAESMQGELANLENTWDRLYRTAGDIGIVQGALKLLSAGIDGVITTFKGLEKVMGFTFAFFGDHTLLANIASREAEEASTRMSALAKERAQEFSAEVMAMKISNDAKIAEYEREIKANETLAEGGEKIFKEKVKYLQQELDAFIISTTTKKELTEAELEAMRELAKERERIARAENLAKAELNVLNQVEAFDILIAKVEEVGVKRDEALKGVAKNSEQEKLITKKAQVEIQNLYDDFANKVLADMAKEGKDQEAVLKAQYAERIKDLDYLRGVDAVSEAKYYEDKLELARKFGEDLRPIITAQYAFQQREEAKARAKEAEDAKAKASQIADEKAQRIEVAHSTFDTLNALNNAYTISQTNQLQKQLEQGVISQEQYEQSLRKIKRRQAVIDKAGALFNIALNTAQGVSSATASVLGLPLAPIIGAMGAVQAGIVLATPIPYNKGTKKVPMVRGAVRGKDSVHAILTPNERVVPEDINSQPGYSALMDLAHDRKISDKEAGFIAKLATGGVYASQNSTDIDYNQLGKSIAKYIPHTDVRIDHNGIAVITDRSHANMNRLKTRL
jgi:tape measure domain-containing protein